MREIATLEGGDSLMLEARHTTNRIRAEPPDPEMRRQFDDAPPGRLRV